MEEEKPHEHVWNYKGLEHEIGRQLKKVEGFGTRYERNYFDVFFCTACLKEKLVPRYLGKNTGEAALEASTPRGNYLLQRAVEDPEEDATTPTEPRKAPVVFERVS